MARHKGQAQIEKANQRLDQLRIEYRKVSEIVPNAYNPNRQNTHEFDLLCKSIEEDGFTQPVIVGLDGKIVDGEHRWRAASALGLDEIPVVVVPMDSAQARIATLRHNRARGSEDVELSVAVLRDLDALGALDWAADSLDLSDVELERLLEDVPAPEALANDEFSEAWIPQRAVEGSAMADVASATESALARGREQESRLADAKSEEEKAQIRKDNAVYRIMLTFAGDEAALVKRVLGDQPASRVLALCRTADEPAESTTA